VLICDICLEEVIEVFIETLLLVCGLEDGTLIPVEGAPGKVCFDFDFKKALSLLLSSIEGPLTS